MRELKEFRVGDILKWQSKIQIRPVDIPSIIVDEGEKYPFIGQSSTNNGIIGHINVDTRFLNNAESEPCIIVSSNTQEFSYVETPFFLKEAGGSMSYMKNKKLNQYNALYLITVLKKELKSRWTYGVKATNTRIRESLIKLPVENTLDAEPDWNYMEVYIKEIEKKYVEKIEKNNEKCIKGYLKYLAYSSVKELSMTSEDTLIMDQYSKANFKPFKLNKIFDNIKRGKRIKSMDRVEGELPFITAGVENMGFSDFIGNLNTEVFPKNSLTIDMFGNTFYRNYEFGADDHVAVLYHSENLYNKRVLQYIQVCINKKIIGKYSYSRNFYVSDAYEVEVELPITDNQELDVDLMGKYILVIEKKATFLLKNKLDEKIKWMKEIIK